MPSPRQSSGPRSSAEKRVLWEIRQRYHIKPPAKGNTIAPAAVAAAPLKPLRGSSYGAGGRPPRGMPPQPGARSGRPRPAGRTAPHWGRRIALLLIVVLVLSGGIFGYKILAAGNKISVANRSVLGQLKDLLFSSNETLTGEGDGRVNILLMAIGGEGHNGENLADTIIVASIKPQTNEVAMLSIPRDLYVQVPDEEYYSKINAVHAYGESQAKDGGPKALRTTVEEITGLPMHYFVRVDFIAFKNIVDAVGGVNVTIENSFFDYWHKISFPAGTEEMNGERALAYVRARYIEGPEGGDFRRAARQQQILLALREKVFSVQTALDFTAVNSILNSLSDNIRTDMHLWEMKRFFEMARGIDGGNVRSVVLDTGPRGVLVGSTEVLGGAPASVLQPRTGDYSEIQTLAQNIFTVGTPSPSANPTTAETTPEPTETEEPATIAKPTLEIRNGTNITGLAARTADTLKQEGYEVLTVGNAKDRATPETTAYALASDHLSGAQAIAAILDAKSDSGLPSSESASSADVLIILGADAQ